VEGLIEGWGAKLEAQWQAREQAREQARAQAWEEAVPADALGEVGAGST